MNTMVMLSTRPAWDDAYRGEVRDTSPLATPFPLPPSLVQVTRQVITDTSGGLG